MAINGSLFDKYFKYVEHTESPLTFHRWSMLTALGATLGRQYKFPHGDFNIYPNMYVMLMGDPGTRKSTSIKLAKKMISAAGYDRFAADKTTKEKFLLDLEGAPEEGDFNKVDKNKLMVNLFGNEGADMSEPKETFIVADEFNQFAGSGNLEFYGLLGALWDWDDENNCFTQRLKNSKSVSIYQPTISMLAGNTHAGFAAAFPPQTNEQGFLSRLILVHGETSGVKIAFPKRPADEDRQAVIDHLVEVKRVVHGVATLSPQAMDAMEVIYRTFPGLEDARFKHYSTRRFTHLIKLAMLSAASNLRVQITIHDVLFANTLLTYTESSMPTALGEYGKAKNADVAARVMGILSDATKPLTLTQIWKAGALSSELERVENLLQLLQSLTIADKVQYIKGTAAGQPEGYLLRRKGLNTNRQYINYALLKEAQR